MNDAARGLCLVTGATGFIGGRVAQRLVRERYRVRCLVRASSDTSALRELDVDLAVGDLTSARTLVSAASGCRLIIHCAAMVSDWATLDEIRQANVVGTRSIVEAAGAASVERLVHVSTTDVYGHPGGPGVDESHPQSRFGNWYSATKRAAEGEVRRGGVAHAILRPATVYGPGSEDVVGEMARAMRGRQMLLIDRGRAVAGLSYVENVVDAVVLALENERALGQAYNVTDGLDITWRQFLGDLAEGLGYREPRLSLPYGVAYGIGFGLEQGYRVLRGITGIRTRPLLSLQAVQVLGRDQDFSNRKLRDELGWEPRVSYEAGLETTLEWLRASGLGG